MHDDIYAYTKPKQVSSERLVRCWRFVYVVVTQLRKKLVWENMYTSHWRLTMGSFVKNSRFTKGVTERN